MRYLPWYTVFVFSLFFQSAIYASLPCLQNDISQHTIPHIVDSNGGALNTLGILVSPIYFAFTKQTKKGIILMPLMILCWLLRWGRNVHLLFVSTHLVKNKFYHKIGIVKHIASIAEWIVTSLAAIILISRSLQIKVVAVRINKMVV